MNKEKAFAKFFNSLPQENTREYEVKITEFAGTNCEEKDAKIIEKLIDSSRREDVAYAAFYCMTVIHRRNKNFNQLKQLFDKYEKRFGNRISYDHLKILFLIESDSMYDYNDILRRSLINARNMGENAGYIHAFADVFVTICERCEAPARDFFIKTWYNKALDAVNKAIELDPSYAKYYCTKARIVTLKNCFAEALKLISKATSEENANRKDYPLRISNYQFYNMYILLRQSNYNLEQLLAGSSGASKAEEEKNKLTKNAPRAFTGKSPYTFVSYAHKDAPNVYNIIGKLSADGYNVWYDEGLTPGEEFWEELAQRIINCRCVLLFLSSDSVDSGFVRREINFALEEKKPIISVFLDGVTLSPGMRIQLNVLQNLSLLQCKSVDEFVGKIEKALDAKGL